MNGLKVSHHWRDIYADSTKIKKETRDSSVFAVMTKEDINMMSLKKLIKEEGKNGVLANVDAKDLILWKVRMIMGQRHHN